VSGGSGDLLDLPPGSLAAVGLGLAHEVRAIERVRSAEEAAEQLGVDLDHLLKTLVVRRADDDFVFVLVPASRSLSWPKLRQHLGVSRLSLPDAAVAQDATGYERGAITPLGSSRAWPVVADATIPHSGHVTVGSGHHGASLFVDADDLLTALRAEVADVTDDA
jgi:Cys-tRNA(Pro)/Cys-tRNA(Cys) deacylase